jgi:methylenetetrahydrofolate reductase (NADPH)
VMAVPSATMARQLSTDFPELAVPEPIIRRIEQDRDAGIEVACDLVSAIRESGVFAGVHLIPVARYREVALRLEHAL